MASKSPHELDQGAILTQDVYNLDGGILFQSGTSLTDRQIEILMMWGVQSVEVEGSENGDNATDIANLSQKDLALAEAAITERYKLVKSSHPVVEILRRISVFEAAKAGQSGIPQS